METGSIADQAVFYEHVFVSGMEDIRRHCPSCGSYLYYEGSVRWHNGDQANFFACDCENDGQRRVVTLTRRTEWDPFKGVSR